MKKKHLSPSIGKKVYKTKRISHVLYSVFYSKYKICTTCTSISECVPKLHLDMAKGNCWKNVNWNSFWMRGHGTKFFTLTRFPLFFFSLYKTFIYACWCYKTRILMWNTSVCPGPELETILAIPISLWNQLENESGQFLKL